MKKTNKYRFLFAGGGTGGHLFPAIAVADKIKSLRPEAEIIFVGTKNKIESVVVPKLGYRFATVWIKGFARKMNIQNLIFPLRVVVSLVQSFWISMKFRPAVAVGSGGYVSGPAVYAASLLGADVVLLEQNSYPGVTTKLLEARAREIHICFEDAGKYLKNKKAIKLTGNPVRSALKLTDKKEALAKFGFNTDRKTLLVLGGSLGAGSINKAVSESLADLNDIQIIWQTGKNYFDSYKLLRNDNVWIGPFIDDMSAAFSAADLLVSRAGATTISELSALALPVILVPSPNVAENHQYKNAESLTKGNAAVLLEDKQVSEKLSSAVKDIINDEEKLRSLSSNIKKFAGQDAALVIAQQIIKFAEAK